MSLDHPIHPAAVHWPIAFLTTSYTVDVLTSTWSSLPAQLTAHLPSPTFLSQASYYALSLGILTSLPAIATGIAQAYNMASSQGIYNADGTIRTKAKILSAHAAMNDAVVAGSTWIWWGKRSAAAGAVGLGKKLAGEFEYTPTKTHVVVGAVLGLALAFAANLGGTLTYNHGMGLSIGKKSEKKDK